MKTKIRSLLVGVFSLFICSALIPYRVCDTPTSTSLPFHLLLAPPPPPSPSPPYPLPNSVPFSLHPYPVSFQVNKDESCFIYLAFVLIISLFAFFEVCRALPRGSVSRSTSKRFLRREDDDQQLFGKRVFSFFISSALITYDVCEPPPGPLHTLRREDNEQQL